MNTIAIANTAPQQLSSTARFIAAAVVTIALSAAWASAGKASHEAVVASMGTLNATHVTLPAVEIVSHRDATTQVSAGIAASNEL